MTKPVWYSYIFLIVCNFITASAWSSIPYLNVKIASDLGRVQITGLDLKSESGNKTESGLMQVAYNCGSKNNHNLLASISSPSGFLNWDDQKYRGEFKIYQKNNKCELVNYVSLEGYINSLLAKEMNKNWPIEALKAQAIAARTYALFLKNKNKNKFYDLVSSEFYQVSGSFDDENVTTAKATKLTFGEVLLNQNDKTLVPIFFHSKCGGFTWMPEYIWGNKVKGYKSVSCPYCHEHGTKEWEFKVNNRDFKKVITEMVKPDVLSIVPDKINSPVVRYYDGGDQKQIKKSMLRKMLGIRDVMSNKFVIKKQANQLTIEGVGRGHGVGLCQFGAYEMAKQGKSYKEILKHYFPNFEIKKIY
ncbi:MAG: SpoIID/LytB domain-containing protein [Bacteriovoracaceae bacterium]